METINLLLIIFIIIIFIIVGILTLLYSNGYWKVKSRSIIKTNTYDLFSINVKSGIKVKIGEETNEVHRIIYRNNRVKYVTKTYRH